MDREAKRRPATSDEWGDHISEFTHKWEIGSAEHSAVHDYYNLQRLYEEIGEEPNNKLRFLSGQKPLTQAQYQDLIMQRIALLEHAIDQKTGTLPGYGNAYDEISTAFHELLGSAGQEARVKYAEPEKQMEHVRRIYAEAMGYVLADLFAKQNPQL